MCASPSLGSGQRPTGPLVWGSLRIIEEDATDFELALAEEVPVILLSFADPTRWLRRIKARGVRAICQVRRMEDARVAV